MASEIFQVRNADGKPVSVSLNKSLFYFLAIDQGGYDKARDFIREQLAGEKVINSEMALLILACQIAKPEITEKLNLRMNS